MASLLAIGGREAPPPGGQRQNLRAEISEGRRFVFRDPILRKMIACTGTANLFGAMALSLEIIFLVRVDRVRGLLGGRMVGALLPAAQDARRASKSPRS